jgi:hypothetical protein
VNPSPDHQPCVQGKRDGSHRLGRHDDSRREYLRSGQGLLAYADDQGEYGEKLNNPTKLVASSKLDDAPWGDFPAATVTRDPAATIRELKEPGSQSLPNVPDGPTRGSLGTSAVTQGVHVRPILVDPCVYLISSADGTVAGDDDIDVARHALEQPERGKVVLDRVSGVQVEQRNQDIGKHVASDENPAFLNQQRRMARSMR